MPVTERINSYRKLVAEQLKSNAMMQSREAARVASGLSNETLCLLADLGMEVTAVRCI